MSKFQFFVNNAFNIYSHCTVLYCTLYCKIDSLIRTLCYSVVNVFKTLYIVLIELFNVIY